MPSDGGKEAPRPQSEVSSCGERKGAGGPGRAGAGEGPGPRQPSRRGAGVRPTAPPHRRVVVEADVRASPVSRSLDQLALLRAVRWAWVGSQGEGDGTEGARGGGRAGGGGRIQRVSFCSSRPASHWLHSGFSATTKSRLVLVSLCAWNSLEAAQKGGALRCSPPLRPGLAPRPRPQAPPPPQSRSHQHLEQFPQSMMAL